MSTTLRHRITATVTMALAAGSVAIGALALSAPASAANSFQTTCEQKPYLYADGAVLGVYSTQKRGFDRDEICKVYDANNKLLGTTITTDYNYFRPAAPVQPPPVQSHL
jgi:hypothetical protein